MLHSGGYTDKIAGSEGLCSLTAKCLNNLISSRVGQVTYKNYLFFLRSKFWCLKSAYTPCWVPRPFSRSSPDQMWLSKLLSFIWKDGHLWAPWLRCDEDRFNLLLTAQLFTLFFWSCGYQKWRAENTQNPNKKHRQHFQPNIFLFLEPRLLLCILPQSHMQQSAAAGDSLVLLEVFSVTCFHNTATGALSLMCRGVEHCHQDDCDLQHVKS